MSSSRKNDNSTWGVVKNRSSSRNSNYSNNSFFSGYSGSSRNSLHQEPSLDLSEISEISFLENSQEDSADLFEISLLNTSQASTTSEPKLIPRTGSSSKDSFGQSASLNSSQTGLKSNALDYQRLCADINTIASLQSTPILKIGMLFGAFKDLPSINWLAASTLALQIGNLTHQSLQYRAEHDRHFKDKLRLINTIQRLLGNQAGTPKTITNTIKGLSQLQLSSSVGTYQQTLEMLYQAVVNNLNQYRLSDSITIINSATRLDPNNNDIIFSKVQDLICHVIDNYKNKRYPYQCLYPELIATLLYSVAILHSNHCITISDDIFNFLKTQVNLKFNNFSSIDAKRSDSPQNIINYNQIYSALKYFESLNYDMRDVASIMTECHSILSAQQPSPTNSELQNDIIRFTKKSMPEANVEHAFKQLPSFPVDGYFRDLEEEKSFIMQVDGPSHFFHDDQNKKAGPTQKTKFRDTLLTSLTLVPSVTVSYDEW